MDTSQLPPEIYELLLTSGVDIGNLQDDIGNQQKTADRIRGLAPAAGGRTVRDGIFVAASPWETAAKSLAGGMGHHAEAGIPQMQKSIRSGQADQFSKILEALRKQSMLGAIPDSMGSSEPNVYGAMGY